MNAPIHIPKEIPDLPDAYGVKIVYTNGKSEAVDIVQHKFIKETFIFEITTADDLWMVYPLGSIQRIEFDKRFSKMVALRNEQLKDKGEQ